MVMSKKNYKIISAICVVISVVCLVASVFVIVNAAKFSISKVVAGIAAFAAVCAGTSYMLSQFGKAGGSALRLFYVFFGICVLFRTVATVRSQFAPENGVMLYTLVYGAIIVLAVGKNLGKRASYFAAGFIYAVETFLFLYCLYVEKGIFFGGTIHDSVSIMLAGVTQFLSSLTVMFTAAKYLDKEARGTK